MIKAVIFDLDGTLVDTVDFHAEAFQKAFKKFGKEIPYEKIRSQIGKGGDQFLPVFLTKKEIEDFGDELLDERAKIYKSEYLPRIKPFPKVRELFEKLKDDGKKIAIGSSSPEDELKRVLKIAGVADLIEEKTSGDDAEESKPEPDIFQAALEKLGNPKPSEVIVVGDTPFDAEAAKKAGIVTIGVLSGGFPKADLEKDCAEIYESPADLLDNYEGSLLAD